MSLPPDLDFAQLTQVSSVQFSSVLEISLVRLSLH